MNLPIGYTRRLPLARTEYTSDYQYYDEKSRFIRESLAGYWALLPRRDVPVVNQRPEWPATPSPV